MKTPPMILVYRAANRWHHAVFAIGGMICRFGEAIQGRALVGMDTILKMDLANYDAYIAELERAE